MESTNFNKIWKCLEELCRDVDLSGLDIIQEELRLMRTESQRVEQEAQHMLTAGLNNLSQQEVIF